MFEILATKNDNGRTIFKLLCKYLPELPLSKIEKIFRKSDLKINGQRKIAKSYVVQEGDHIVVYGVANVESITDQTFDTISYDFKSIYEDNNILVIDKRVGVDIHDSDNCLDKQVLSYLKYQPKDSFKPSHVGRLDKETSGLIIYGKTYDAVAQLNENSDKIIKKYIFQSDIDLNNYDEKHPLVVEFFISKDEKKRMMKATQKEVPYSKKAITHFYNEGSKKIAQLITGRKHQIRLSLKYLGKPIYGDKKYLGKKASRLMLHSYYVKLLGFKGDLKYLNKLELFSLPKFK
ncbi:RluA family pseudouridine synthase [Mycoplasma sp. Pen4]|uniref:pseudouridine synthase family protein n=1 Tax=Mycoplasma sp. Pen4 TaxID=640330 RepID=UPI0016546351|nr:RluA family pseudouridine synthase [Mycoplasma sp. Pen4]QNM93705.1 RluA family pseudouridine synthase [Mycoplasma sp. Pen4]